MKRSCSTATALAVAALLLAPPLAAQTATSNAGSNSGAQAAITNNSVSRIPRQAPGAFAPGLVAGADTCATSTGVGLSTPFGGLSVGGASIDEGCEIRAMTRMLHGLGQKSASIALMCQSARVRDAMIIAGAPCPTLAAPEEYFWDKKGRRFLAVKYPNDAAAKRDGAQRADTGEWVKLVK